MSLLDPKQIHRYRQDLRVEATLKGQTLHFDTTWGLFSPREIDEGTRLLLDYVDVASDAHCVDLGCGYGPLGITLAKLAPQGKVLLIDKDVVAVDYANRNIELNRLDNALAQTGNGLEAVEGDGRYDCVVSNIPAKVGSEMLYLFLDDAWRLLKPGGKLTVVTINGLRQFIKRSFTESFGNYKKLKQGKSYTVAMAVKG